MNEQELKKTLLNVFKQEASERLLSMSNCIISIENKGPGESSSDILKVIYREAHSIKGAARSISLVGIEQLFQNIESVFYDMINGKLTPSTPLFDLLIEITKELRSIVVTDEIEAPENVQTIKTFTERLLSILGAQKEAPQLPNQLQQVNTEQSVQKEKPKVVEEIKKETHSPKAEKPSAVQDHTDVSTVRIDSSKLDRLLRNSENLIVIKQFFAHKYPVISDISSDMNDSMRKIDKLLSSLNYLVTEGFVPSSTQSIDNPVKDISDNLKTLKDSIKGIKKKVLQLTAMEKEDQRFTSNMIDEFLNGLKEIAMVPISNVTGILPIMTREIAQKLDKKVSLEITGDSMMLDRRILDSVKDPILHIIRNSIDHGIESPSTRKKLNKPEIGLIKMSIAGSDSNYLEVTISDDGAGVNLQKLKRKLLENKIAKEDEINAMTEERLLNYIFMHGFSTSDIITDLSGRGLGLSIVKENIEFIGGSVSLFTSENKGSTITIKLPITMATYKGIIVKDANMKFILPSVGTEIIARVLSKDVKTVENKLTITYDDRVLPLVSLANILGLQSAATRDTKYITAAILGKDSDQVALLVEDVLEEEEIILKDLGKNLIRVPFVSGVTVFSSGEIIPILNIRDIIKNANSASISLGLSKGKLEAQNKRKKKRILVAEDSPTSRTLIKNVLESAGYEVVTKNDGQEAITYLMTNKVDALVSDIEMPRLNGFELTRKVRSDDKYRDLPIVLVTSLSSREDMEKGIEAGANSYIIKSQFDQSVLIETIKSLI
ncbi:MAG: response regulator [Lentisphaerota bacterium]